MECQLIFLKYNHLVFFHIHVCSCNISLCLCVIDIYVVVCVWNEALTIVLGVDSQRTLLRTVVYTELSYRLTDSYHKIK